MPINTAAVPLGYPALPTGAADNGNVRITQFHGTGTAPGNYTGTEELIVPTVKLGCNQQLVGDELPNNRL